MNEIIKLSTEAAAVRLVMHASVSVALIISVLMVFVPGVRATIYVVARVLARAAVFLLRKAIDLLLEKTAELIVLAFFALVIGTLWPEFMQRIFN